MKLSLVFSALVSIVGLATAYPTQGTIAKLSYVEKPTDLVEKREELDTDLFLYQEYIVKRDEGKREELDTDLFLYQEYIVKRDEGKREELDTDLFLYQDYIVKRDEGKREELDADGLNHISHRT
ncbi:uncharacterized protein BJ212DRAFT_1575984 [Suillus subaureus]|uniref:Uncharacterized protein n=1 Tax=Suillus subaureus TaxID=48587 RepID=A0A9P7EFV3_9AGAM|nr:uncharacterized protein BJ212DRAFT_1575984 [Suillus subaureus]KAG1819772.1 hypothetical protein BJ212DRAFT_1575984 [Suillus subaureus]